MGVSSNLEVFLPEKHVNDPKMDHNSTQFREKPTTETQDKGYQTPTPEKHEVRPKRQQSAQERDQEQQSKEVRACLNLRLEIPQYKDEEDDQEDSNDGFKTPTSEEHKIPPVLQCPPAPRKRKTLSSTKEIKGCCPRVLDFTSQEIESTLIPVDLDVAGNNKKVRNLFMGPYFLFLILSLIIFTSH